MNQITEQADLTALYTISGVWGLIWYIILVIALWRTFSKAGWPGILAIIPIVNIFILVKIAGYVGVARAALHHPDRQLRVRDHRGRQVSARTSAHGGAFSFFLLCLLQPIGYLILGFGSSRYQPVN